MRGYGGTRNVFYMLQIEVFTCTLAAVMVCCVICVVFQTEDLRKNPLHVTRYGTGLCRNAIEVNFAAINRRMMKAACHEAAILQQTDNTAAAASSKRRPAIQQDQKQQDYRPLQAGGHRTPSPFYPLPVSTPLCICPPSLIKRGG